MGKFIELNDNINKVLMKLLSSQDLCKYLYYNSSNPLSESDITDVTDLLYTKIFPYPTPTSVFKNSDGEPTASSIINVFFDDYTLSEVNNKFKSGVLVFRVLVHMSLWKLDTSKLRPYCILNLIDEMFNEGRVIGLGKGEFESCRIIWEDENYSGYALVYKDYEFS